MYCVCVSGANVGVCIAKYVVLWGKNWGKQNAESEAETKFTVFCATQIYWFSFLGIL